MSCSSPTARSTPSSSSSLLETSRPREALALWRGEALADVADEPFAAAEIRRLDELRLRAPEMRSTPISRAGRQAEVIGELDALVAAHPLRERLHGQRMLALYRAGRQSEALAAYRDARAELVEQIGVEPGAELRRLHERILGQDPVLDPRGPAGRVGPDAGGPAATAAAHGGADRRRRRMLIAGVTAFGVIRVLRRTACRTSARTGWGSSTPWQAHHQQYRVGRGPGAVAAGGGSVWVANQLDGTVSRIDRPHEQDGADPGRRRARRARLRRRRAVGGRRRRGATSRRSTPVSNKVVHSIEAVNAPKSLWRWRPVRCGWCRASTAGMGRIEIIGTGVAARYRSPGREGDRGRRGRRGDLGDEARRPAPSPASTRAPAPSPIRPRERRQRADGRRDRRRRGRPRQPRRRECLGVTNPATNAVSGTVHARRRPVARSPWAKGRCGWPGARKGPSSSYLRGPSARAPPEFTPGAARRRWRWPRWSGVDRDELRSGGRRTAAGRCAWPLPSI